MCNMVVLLGCAVCCYLNSRAQAAVSDELWEGFVCFWDHCIHFFIHTSPCACVCVKLLASVVRVVCAEFTLTVTGERSGHDRTRERERNSGRAQWESYVGQDFLMRPGTCPAAKGEGGRDIEGGEEKVRVSVTQEGSNYRGHWDILFDYSLQPPYKYYENIHLFSFQICISFHSITFWCHCRCSYDLAMILIFRWQSFKSSSSFVIAREEGQWKSVEGKEGRSQRCSCRWGEIDSRLEVDWERGGENEMMREMYNKRGRKRLMNGGMRKDRWKDENKDEEACTSYLFSANRTGTNEITWGAKTEL